jgi:hypothetical protein
MCLLNSCVLYSHGLINIFSYRKFSTLYFAQIIGGGRDCMIVEFTSTCEISAYHILSCEFEPRSWCGQYNIM